MRRTSTAIVTLLIFVLPFALVWGGVVPVEVRWWLYAVAGAVAFAVVRRVGLSWRDLGFRWDNTRAAWLPYAALAVLGVAAIVIVARVAGRVPRAEWWLAPHFAYGLLIPVSVVQEFFFRGLLIPLLQRVNQRRWFVITADASLFAFLHVIFPDPASVLPLSFLGGIVFAWLWLRWPNIWLASAAHVVLNAAFVLFCFGSFEMSCMAR